MIQNTLIVVLVIVLIIWLGISIYLFLLDRKLKKLEKISDVHNSNIED